MTKPTGNKTGRPSKWNVIEKHYDKIMELAANGYTDDEISRYIGIARSTFSEYKKKYSNFFNSLINAKDKADLTAINKLFQRVNGYDYVEEHLEYIPGTGNDKTQVKVVKKIKKQVAPDVTAQIFWLTNRRRGDWKRINDYEKANNNDNDVPKVPEFDDMSDEELIKYIENAKGKED